MTNTHLHRLIGIFAATVAGLTWAPGALATPNPAVNQVTDSSFDAGPLQAFSRSCGNPYIAGEWNAEAATLITGTSAGVSPHSPNGMLRVNAIGGTASQVNQIIDVSSYASDIDGGDVIARFSIWFNSPSAGVTPKLLFQAGDSQTCVGTLNLVGGGADNGYNRSTVGLSADGDPGTWEQIRGAIVLPSGARFLELQFWAVNSEISGGGVFFDTASVTLAPCEVLSDNSFDSGSGPLQPFFRTCGDPYIPGEWNVEDADLIVGPSAGVSPFFGDGMLRVNATGGVGSQVVQIVDVSEFAEAIDNGNVEARFFSWFNAAEGAAEPRIVLEAGESQTCVGTVVPVGGSTLSGFNQLLLPTTADGNSATWEGLGSNLWLPPGTRFLQYQILGVNATIPATGLFFDESSVCLQSALPTFGLAQTTLGQARLGKDGNGYLTVDNIGSSGEDGVAIDVSAGEGFALEGPLDPTATPVGAAAEFRMVASVDGAPEQEIGRTTMVRAGSGYAASADFSGIGASGYTLRLKDSLGSVVFEQAGLANGSSFDLEPTIANGGIKCKTVKCPDVNGNKYEKIVYRQTGGGLFSVLVAAQTFDVPIIEFDPVIVATNSDLKLTTIEYRAANMPQLTIESEAVVLFGAEQAGLGEAHLGGDGSAGLTISNIGSSGEDGLRSTSNDIEDDQFIAYGGSWDPPVPTAGSGSTAMSIDIGGFFGGVEQSLIVDNIGSSGMDGVSIAPDSSAIGSTHADVAVFQGGTQVLLVQNFDLSTGPISAVDPAGLVNPWPTGAGASLIDKSTGSARGIGDPFNGIDVFVAQWSAPVDVTIPGESTVQGDEIRLQPLNPSATFEGIESVEFLLTDFDSVTLTGTGFAPPTLCPGDLDGDDDTDVFDFAVFAAGFGSSGLLPFTGADLDGNGAVDVFDFAIFATDFGCGAN